MLPSVPEIEWHYAAADLYVGPSIEDSFAMPPLEAMACGIPSIVSSQAGVSEVITDGVDGFILDNPTDSNKLANLIALVYSNKDLRRRIGKAAAETARQYTWDRNAEQLCRVFQDVLRQKECPRAAVASEEPLR
jgi:UDP-glucose:(heptosyl)LPS alpha-1,3-glucosyltransferase